jgi:hypothetical protein
MPVLVVADITLAFARGRSFVSHVGNISKQKATSSNKSQFESRNKVRLLLYYKLVVRPMP